MRTEDNIKASMSSESHGIATRIWLRLIDATLGITGKERLELHGFSEEILKFRSEYIYGFAVYGGQLLLEEKLFQEGREVALEMAFLHERGHKESGWLSFMGAVAEQTFLSPPGLLAGFSIVCLSLVSTVSETAVYGLSIFMEPVRTAFLTLGVYLTASISSYYCELRAEFFALERMGIERYRNAQELSNEIYSSTPISRILGYPSHPPEWLTVKLYRLTCMKQDRQ